MSSHVSSGTKLRSDRTGMFAGRSASRAIIDIGSNTVRLVVYGGSARAPTVLMNEKVAARLGRAIAETGELPKEAIDLAMRGLRRYRLLLDDMEATDVTVVATAAARDASNGEAFLAQVRALGFEPQLVAGLEEARLSAQGVRGAFPGATGAMADLGGGSLELVRMSDDDLSDAVSLPLGTLRLPTLGGGKPGVLRKAATRKLVKAGWNAAIGGPLYLVGGTWRSMAVAAMQARKYPLSDPHGFELNLDDAAKLTRRLVKSDPNQLTSMPRISSMRAAYLPDAAVLLQALLKQLKPDRIVFSSWGLREGLLFDRLDASAQRQDPLLAGVAAFAELRGVPATLAARMAGWTARAVRSVSAGSERVRLAATMLALASMQTEPNLRTRHGIEWALHKRWIALDAEGRAMVAAAVAANGNSCDLPAGITRLASEDALEEAMVWGLAIRLCRRISGQSNTALQTSGLQVEGDKLVLLLDASHSGLYGLPNEKDMSTLAKRLGLKPEMRVVDIAAD